MPTPFQVKPGELHAFYGQIKTVDRASRTVTVALGMRFTFSVPPSTPIRIRKGGATDFNAIRPGLGALIEARRGTKDWTAVRVVLDPKARFSEEFSVKTVADNTITGPAALEFIVYEPPSQVINRGLNLGNHSGFYLLSIRPDGTVSGVKTLKSLGSQELEERATRRFMQIRFRPGSITEARMPISYRSVRRR